MKKNKVFYEEEKEKKRIFDMKTILNFLCDFLWWKIIWKRITKEEKKEKPTQSSDFLYKQLFNSWDWHTERYAKY